MRALIYGALTASAMIVAVPAAAQDGFIGQAQRFLKQGGDNQAYERGREDQARQERYNREKRRQARQDQRYHDQQYGYDDPYYHR